jgi:hypothetical protein
MMPLYNSIVTSGIGPNFPAGTPAGYQADGTELWLAFGIAYESVYPNAPPQVSMQVGKFSQTFGEALFPFGGQELGTGPTLQFNVLVSSGIWVPGGVSIPNGAIVLGYDVDGEPLFGALANLDQLYPPQVGIHPGKTKASFNGLASIGWGGTEYFVGAYDVLVGGV